MDASSTAPSVTINGQLASSGGERLAASACAFGAAHGVSVEAVARRLMSEDNECRDASSTASFVTINCPLAVVRLGALGGFSLRFQALRTASQSTP